MTTRRLRARGENDWMTSRQPRRMARARVVALVALVALPLSMLAVLQSAATPTAVVLVLAACVTVHAASLMLPSRPITAFGIGSAGMLALALISLPGFSSAVLLPSSVAYLVLLWFLADLAPATAARIGLGVGVAGAVVASLADARAHPGTDGTVVALEAIGLAAVVATVWGAGTWHRARRDTAAARASRQVAEALAAERMRIGRDLHDVVSHSLTVMIAQAQAAQILAADGPGADDMGRVADTGRAAMQSLRGLLRVLDNEPAAPLEPAPGIDGLEQLVAGASSAEHRTVFSVHGSPGSLSRESELALFRTVQEALTNAIRHVRPPLAIDVRLEWSATTATAVVSDDSGSGPRAAEAGLGTGLIGAASRLEHAGGALAVDRSIDGWTVRATVPVDDTAGGVE